MQHQESTIQDNGTMLNAYPDSMGGTLADIVHILERPEFQDVFRSFYVLPSIFHTDLDRGFSVIDYGINKELADKSSLEDLSKLGINLKLDFILNHLSVLSPQFQDILKNGEKSPCKEFFIPWNLFWKDHGEMTADGYIQPDAELIKDMFFRKPGLPILMVRMPGGKDVPYWNTFYQEIVYPKLTVQDFMTVGVQYAQAQEMCKIVNSTLTNGQNPKDIEFGRYSQYKTPVVEVLEARRQYLGQMDLNIKSPLVWGFYDETLSKLAEYGADIVRLDAFAYAPKEPGSKNFLNDPDTWELLVKVRNLADRYHLKLLPEIHATYAEKTYEHIAQKGYMTYDFFLPGLILDALESHQGAYLIQWAEELQEKNIRVVNMLGCHDGIPLLDLKGLLPDERIESLINTVVNRGGAVKNLHGQKNMYYQVNATYYSALGEDDRKMLLARALQLFMPGKPQIWYLDLFAGKNDYDAVKNASSAAHKEINRTNLSLDEIDKRLQLPVVQKQLEMLRLRNTCPAFGFGSQMEIRSSSPERFKFIWRNDNHSATLTANLRTYEHRILTEAGGEIRSILRSE